jgi:hypothetical protein
VFPFEFSVELGRGWFLGGSTSAPGDTWAQDHGVGNGVNYVRVRESGYVMQGWIIRRDRYAYGIVRLSP